jgi:hypothetical protein
MWGHRLSVFHINYGYTDRRQPQPISPRGLFMFNLVVLDDERINAHDIHKNVRDWGFTEPFVALHSAANIKECLEIPKRYGWSGDWLFLLDCNLTDSFDGTYGGFEAWSLLVEQEPVARPAFAVVYSQTIVDLIQAATKGGPRAAQALRPKLFKRAADERGEHEAWWRSALDWLCDRQTQIVKNSDSSARAEICQRLRETLGSGSPGNARRLFDELTLEVTFSGMSPEVWTIGQVFPTQANALLTSNGLGDMKWQSQVIEVCYSLLPQFPKVLNEIARLVFGDLTLGDGYEREFGRRLNMSIYHAGRAYKDTPTYKEFYERAVCQWFQNNLMVLKEHRLKNAYHLLPPSLYEALSSDHVNDVLDGLSIGGEPGTVADNLEQLSDYCASVFSKHPWLKREPDPRRDFTSLPITCAVADAIVSVLDAQATRFGGLPGAIPVPPPLTVNGKTYCIFKTQEYGEGEHLDPQLMVERCQAEQSNPNKDHLAGLVEIICGQYRGEVHVLQGLRKDRRFRPDRVVTFSAVGGNLKADAVSTLPGLPLSLITEGKIESYKEPDGTLRPKGTYYVLVFPHWN